MNLIEFKSKHAELEKLIPRNRWIEIPIEDKYLYSFQYQGLYAVYTKYGLVYIGYSINLGSRLLSHISYYNNFKDDEPISKIKIKISSLKLPFLQHLEKKYIFRLRPKYNKFIVSEVILKTNAYNLKKGI